MKQIVYYQQKALRIAGSQDEPLLCAKDVCEMLGITNWHDALKRLPNDEKDANITDTLGGTERLVFINEPGFYRLVFLSRKAEAETFKNKVFRQVLPAIRKTGYYRETGPNTPEALLALPPGRRDQAVERLQICEEIHASHRVLQCAKEIAERNTGRRGYTWRSLLRWYYRWLHSGCDPLSLSAYHTLYKNRHEA